MSLNTDPKDKQADINPQKATSAGQTEENKMNPSFFITSRYQGQIFGAKPSVEEFERQLEADPLFKVYLKIKAIVTTVKSKISGLRHTTQNQPITLQKHPHAR